MSIKFSALKQDSQLYYAIPLCHRDNEDMMDRKKRKRQNDSDRHISNTDYAKTSNWSLCDYFWEENGLEWKCKWETEHLIISANPDQTEVHYYSLITEKRAEKHMHDQLSAPLLGWPDRWAAGKPVIWGAWWRGSKSSINRFCVTLQVTWRPTTREMRRDEG